LGTFCNEVYDTGNESHYETIALQANSWILRNETNIKSWARTNIKSYLLPCHITAVKVTLPLPDLQTRKDGTAADMGVARFLVVRAGLI